MLDAHSYVKHALHKMIENALRKHREQQALTRVGLAEAVGVSRQTIHSIETGKYIPSVELALKLSKTLKLPVEDVFWLKKGKV